MEIVALVNRKLPFIPGLKKFLKISYNTKTEHNQIYFIWWPKSHDFKLFSESLRKIWSYWIWIDRFYYIHSLPRTIISDAIVVMSYHALLCSTNYNLLLQQKRENVSVKEEAGKFQWISPRMLTCLWDGENAVVDTSFPFSWHKLRNSLT